VTDDQIPPLADGLFDGGLAADVAPKGLRSAVSLLNVAGRPGSDAELASMAARVRQFSAEIHAVSNASTRVTRATPVPAPGLLGDAGFCSEASFSPATLRSNPIFATRVTRKALTIVAITMLAAGTAAAAAAAAGVLPVFYEDMPTAVVDNVPTIDDFIHPSNTAPSAPSTVDDRMPGEAPTIVVEVEPVDNPDFHGKCTSWMYVSAAEAINPSFAPLFAAADAAVLTIDEYCTTVLAAPVPADEPLTATKPANDAATDSKPADVSPTVANPAGDPPTAAQPTDEKSKDEKSKDEKSKDEKSKDEKSKDEKSKDEKSKDGEHGNGNHDHGKHGHGNR